MAGKGEIVAVLELAGRKTKRRSYPRVYYRRIKVEDMPADADRVNKNIQAEKSEAFILIIEEDGSEQFFPKNVCNICNDAIDRENGKTILEMLGKNVVYHYCMTCNQKISPEQLDTHSVTCFLPCEEIVYHGGENNSKGVAFEQTEGEFRMMACSKCFESTKQ